MRCRLALAALALLVVASGCETDPPTDVSYFDATVQAKVGCQDSRGPAPGYDAQWRIAYRKVADTGWSANGWHNYSCPDEQPPHYLAGSPFSERLAGLTHNTDYVYRLEVQHVSGNAFEWRDSAGTKNGTVYDGFHTPEFPTVATRSAKRVRDSIGMNVRLAYQGTPYANCGAFKAAMAYMGIQYARDGLWPSYDNQWDCLRDIAATTDIKFTMGISDLSGSSRLTQCDPPDGLPPRDATPDEIAADHCVEGGRWDIRVFDVDHGNPQMRLSGRVNDLHNDAAVRSVIDQWNSVNEPDCSTFKNWPEVMHDYQQWLFGLHQDPLLDRPVLGPSFCSGGASETGDLSAWLDMGDMHPYPGGLPPGPSFDSNKAGQCDVVAPGKPCRSTEVGYHTDVSASGHPGVPEDVRSAYTLRLLGESWRRGISRLDLFTVVDNRCGSRGNGVAEEFDFGFYDCNWQPYQGAHTLHNFTSTVGEPATSALPLHARYDTAPANLRTITIQRSDGSYAILMWRDQSLWNRDTRQYVADPGAAVHMTVPDATSVSYVVPTVDATEHQLELAGNGFDFIVSGKPSVVLVR